MLKWQKSITIQKITTRNILAKHIYNLPLQKVQQFIKLNKSDLNKLCLDKKLLELNKLLGKSYYTVELDKFIKFFKIDKDTDYSLSTLEYFNSIKFIDDITHHLNFMQFDLEKFPHQKKDFFYGFCNLLHQENPKLFEVFFEKVFLHYHSGFNNHSNININYKDMATTIAKTKHLKLKESFGEEDENSYFKIYVNDKLIIEENGKMIKTIRKKAYKKLFFSLVDEDYNDLKDSLEIDARNNFIEYKNV